MQKAQRVHRILGALHLAQVLRRHCAPILDARRQACAGRLIGHLQPGLARQSANLLLAQLRLGQRSQRVVHRGSALPGPQIAVVVQVPAVRNLREPQFHPRRLHLGEQLVLAVEAAVAIVARVLRVVQLARLQNVYRDPVLGGKVERRGKLSARQRWRIGNHRQHPLAQRAVRLISQKSRVRAAGVRHHQRIQRPQSPAQLIEFFP